jgi:hypothetical protein
MFGSKNFEITSFNRENDFDLVDSESIMAQIKIQQ